MPRFLEVKEKCARLHGSRKGRLAKDHQPCHRQFLPLPKRKRLAVPTSVILRMFKMLSTFSVSQGLPWQIIKQTGSLFTVISEKVWLRCKQPDKTVTNLCNLSVNAFCFIMACFMTKGW